MAEALAQIVCVRENGKDARTLVAMAPVASQLEAIKGLRKWDGQAKRPQLQLWDDSGARLDIKTGGRILAEPKANPLNSSTPS